jgi:hypothetical protein
MTDQVNAPHIDIEQHPRHSMRWFCHNSLNTFSTALWNFLAKIQTILRVERNIAKGEATREFSANELRQSGLNPEDSYDKRFRSSIVTYSSGYLFSPLTRPIAFRKWFTTVSSQKAVCQINYWIIDRLPIKCVSRWWDSVHFCSLLEW